MSSQREIPFRQIHLDFHTSEAIHGVGERFEPDVFAHTLEKAHVNSVNCFARCHHGWMYFDTQRFPERRHPHLNRNLLRQQIEACHERGIRVPIYVTVQWDHYSAMHHPEWVAVTEEGGSANIYIPSMPATKPFEAGFYRALCVNSPYFDFLKTHVEEIFEQLPVDGFWFDIVTPLDDSSRWTRQAMLERGLNPGDTHARRAYGYEVINTFKNDMTAFVRKFSDDCSIFYNEGHVSPHTRPSLSAYSQLDIESLPSGQWGYAHFPHTARYTRTLGKDWLGMNGKFHTEWGDFHSFKNLAALQFECFQALALGGKICIGDQLHPDGEICQTTYDLIGSVLAEVEAKEAWCTQAQALVDIGVFAPDQAGTDRTPASSLGAMRMLQESGHQFNILDAESNLAGYKVLILPDVIPVSEAFAARLRDFLIEGGALIASYKSGLNPETSTFALDELGVIYKDAAPYSPDFIKPDGVIGHNLPNTEHVMYLRGLHIEPRPGSTLLASATVPYFNRTWEHFTSHRHTPSSRNEQYPAIVQHERVIYFMHPIFTQYNQNAPRWCKTLLLNVLALLLPEPLVKRGGPNTLICTLNEQPAPIPDTPPRLILHLLHYIPIRTSQEMDVIDDVIPLYNIPIEVRSMTRPHRVTAVPSGEAIPFEQRGSYIAFTVPTIIGHQMISIEFA